MVYQTLNLLVPVQDMKRSDENPTRSHREESASKRLMMAAHGDECQSCHQSPAQVQMIQQEVTSYDEEEVALTNGLLQIDIQMSETPALSEDMFPLHRITNFSVYDVEGHLCSFDGGLVEQNVMLYAAGIIKPVYDDDPGPDNGVPAQEVGPIYEWWLSGFDEGDVVIIGLSSPCAHYILGEPSPDYAPYMHAVREKALLTKAVIEFLSSSQNPSYENLVERLGELVSPQDMDPITEDTLANLAQLITDQVSMIDDDGSLLTTHAMQTIISLYKPTIRKRTRNFHAKKISCGLYKSTLTPLVAEHFDRFFGNSEAYFKFDGRDSCFSENISHMVNYQGIPKEGDFVLLKNSLGKKQGRIFRIINFHTSNMRNQFHGIELIPACNTMLGNAGDPFELFFLRKCENVPVGQITGTLLVQIIELPKNWAEFRDRSIEREESLFVKQCYCEETGRFMDGQVQFDTSCCDNKQRTRDNIEPIFGPKKLRSHHEDAFESITWKGSTYQVGCCIRIKSFSFTHDTKNKQGNRIMTIVHHEDDETFPEHYRKMYDKLEARPREPCKIGHLVEIRRDLKGDVLFRVKKLYRPEDTQQNISPTVLHPNLLLYSEEMADVPLDHVIGICDVRMGQKDPSGSVFDPTFYVRERFDKNHQMYRVVNDKPVFINDVLKKTDNETRKLRCLNPFAGAGGLAKGLQESGLVQIEWGVEINGSAAEAFQQNHSKATVYNMSCESFLQSAMNGEKECPQKGDVEIICAGPPCQGFSILNRFKEKMKSQLKNSMIATFLSCCDYYRPKVIIMENVKNFMSFDKSVVFRHMLACLVSVGYQLVWRILQAGDFGIAQKRRRFILIGVAPGMEVPDMPEPTHAFYPTKLDAMVHGRVFYAPEPVCAPLRMITIQDAIGSLSSESVSNRSTPYGVYLQDRTQVARDCDVKPMTALNQARVNMIPLGSGKDWRDLPNISVPLEDGTTTVLLKYDFHNRETGVSSTGRRRGVCPCAGGAKCSINARQANTLIPWHLPHTGNRHRHWRGVYGRLHWDGVFGTLMANPDPSNKQGRVLHPSHSRIISVREYARAQGMKDTFRVCGTALEKYSQVGNAVPPPLARALGLAIKRSLSRLE